MVEQDQQMIGVDQRLFGRTREEIFGMMGQELVERTGRGDQHGGCRVISAPGPARLLPDAGDGSRIADQHRRAQPADVDAQFEGIGGNDEFDRAIAQSFFDLAALGGQVAGAVAADGVGDAFESTIGLFVTELRYWFPCKIRQHNFHAAP